MARQVESVIIADGAEAFDATIEKIVELEARKKAIAKEIDELKMYMMDTLGFSPTSPSAASYETARWQLQLSPKKTTSVPSEQKRALIAWMQEDMANVKDVLTYCNLTISAASNLWKADAEVKDRLDQFLETKVASPTFTFKKRSIEEE